MFMQPLGLPALFYQALADFKRICFCRGVHDFVEGKECSKDFNDKVLVLISKVNAPETL